MLIDHLLTDLVSSYQARDKLDIQLFQKYQKNTTIASVFYQSFKKAKKVSYYCLKFVYI